MPQVLRQGPQPFHQLLRTHTQPVTPARRNTGRAILDREGRLDRESRCRVTDAGQSTGSVNKGSTGRVNALAGRHYEEEIDFSSFPVF